MLSVRSAALAIFLAAGSLQTPEQFLGHKVGADNKLLEKQTKDRKAALKGPPYDHGGWSEWLQPPEHVARRPSNSPLTLSWSKGERLDRL